MKTDGVASSRATTLVVVAFAALWGYEAEARQSSFDGLRLDRGDRVVFSTSSVGERRGRVAEISVDQITLEGGEVVVPQADLKLATYGDSLANGTMLGAAIGLLAGTVTLPGYLIYDAVGAKGCREGGRFGCAAAMAIAFGAAGCLIDKLRVGRTLVYDGGIVRRQVVVTPFGDAHSLGVGATVTW